MIPLLQTFIERAYNKCVEDTMLQPPIESDKIYCPRTFDGWSCWNDTPAGEIANVSCPAFVVGFDPNRMAFKNCLENGTWFKHPLTNVTWSNYTTCIDFEDLALRRTINQVNIIGYSISLIALLISICIFFSFRSLKCIRIKIHENLFISFIINNGIWIIWYGVMESPEVLLENKPGCQILHVILQHFLVCNYFWMFCEGLYLHTILVIAFVDKQSIMKWLYVIGWGVPILLTIIYASVRSSYPSETVHCWINDSPFVWILIAPVCVSMLANLIFLIHIVQVLVTKLRAVKSSDTDQTRKAVRATIILIPLLGLHLLITPFRPEPGAKGEQIYGIISAVVTSFQGLCVSLLFCFCNGEIIFLLQKKWFQRQSLFVSTTMTMQVSRAESFRYSTRQKRGTAKKSGGREHNHICLTDIAPIKKNPSHSKRNLGHYLKIYKKKRSKSGTCEAEQNLNAFSKETNLLAGNGQHEPDVL